MGVAHLRVRIAGEHVTPCGVPAGRPTATLSWSDWSRTRLVRCSTCLRRAPSEDAATAEILRRTAPLIFLDIDGVLVTLRSCYMPRIQPPPDAAGRRQPSWRRADPEAVTALLWLVRETGAQVVLSSAWRGEKVTRWILQVFRSWGLGAAEPKDVTPSLRDEPRGAEIAAWRAAHLHRGPFVIIDDDSDMADLSPHLVQTFFETGLTWYLAQDAAEVLKKRPTILKKGVDMG